MKKFGMIVIILIFFSACKENKKEEVTAKDNDVVFITPLGKEITLPEPSKKLLEKYESAKADFEKNPDDADNIIWFGRRTASLEGLPVLVCKRESTGIIPLYNLQSS